MAIKTFRRKSKNRKSRKYKAGATPGSSENRHNCRTYWNNFPYQYKCDEKGRDGIPRWKMFDYPGFGRMSKGERPTLNGRLDTNY